MVSRKYNSILLRRKVYAFLLILTLFLACQPTDRKLGTEGEVIDTYIGKVIRISFYNNYDYQKDESFMIDKLVVAHRWEMFIPQAPKDSLLIPPKKVIFVEDSISGQHYQPTNYIHFAIKLGNELDRLNTLLPKRKQYELIERQRLMVTGELTLAKKSGKPIKIRIPREYPLYLSVIEK